MLERVTRLQVTTTPFIQKGGNLARHSFSVYTSEKFVLEQVSKNIWYHRANWSGNRVLLYQPSLISFGTLKPLRPPTQHWFTYVNHSFANMAASFGKGSSIAYKRGRSQDSPTPLASPPVLKATKVDDETAQEDSETPAFLRQSQTGKLPAVGAYASMHDAATLGSSTNFQQKFGQSLMTWHGKRNFEYGKVEMMLLHNGHKTN